MRAAWMAFFSAAFAFIAGCDPPSSVPVASSRPAQTDQQPGPSGTHPGDEFNLVADRAERSRDSAKMLPAAAATDAHESTPLPFPSASADAMIAVGTLLPADDDFARVRVGQRPYALPAWSKHLKDLRIALDPGHGGDAHERGYKRGPTGVREAEINLRLARYLAEFLRAAGALVLLTRDDDSDVSLDERAQIANRWPADLFISLHHNAMPRKPGTNYSSVWHHGSVDRCLASLDLARYLADGLHDALGLDQVTDVPVKSDLLMYPGGFAVLRAAEMPAALCECSFYSNPDEEQRLRNPEYVLREAHGLFLALARYAHAGLPRIRLIEPANAVIAAAGPRTLLFELDDGLRRRKGWGWQRRMLLENSIVARVNGRRIEHELLPGGLDRVRLNLPADLPDGTHTVELTFQNQQKNSVLNPRCLIEVVGASRDVKPVTQQSAAGAKTYYLRAPRPAE